jgi:ABC-type transporter Mla subunit MlaD
MIAIGVLGIVVSIAGVIIGNRLVAQVEESVDDSLVVTADALRAVNDSIALTSATVDTLQTGVSTLATTLDAVQASVEQTSTALDTSNDFLAGSLPSSLEAVTEVLPTIESIAGTIDDALRVASRAPFGPDYDPERPFDEAIAELSDAIGPLPEQLRRLAADTDGLSASATTIAAQLRELSTTVTELDEQLTEVGRLVDRYADTAADATTLMTESRKDLERSSTETRTLLILLGIVFGLGQVVPIWLGTVLLGDTPTRTIITRKHLDTEQEHEPSAPDRERADTGNGARVETADWIPVDRSSGATVEGDAER